MPTKLAHRLAPIHTHTYIYTYKVSGATRTSSTSFLRGEQIKQVGRRYRVLATIVCAKEIPDSIIRREKREEN